MKLREGDTFQYYSQLFSVPLKLIVDSNQPSYPYEFYIGQDIHIPGYLTKRYRVRPFQTLLDIASEQNIHLDILYLTNPSLQMMQPSEGEEILLPFRVTSRIVNGKQTYDYDIMMMDITKLLEIYPFIKKTGVGQSVLERPIPEIRVGCGSKVVHMNGSFHANEWITTSVIMTFLNDYLLSLTNQIGIRGISMNPFYQDLMLSIVPMVNPDGVNLVLQGPPREEPHHQQVINMNNGSSDFSNWKANIRGVDLNNQFPAYWELERERKPTAPAPRDYPGKRPLIEPESLAMANLAKTRKFDRVLAFHTQGEVIYWGYEAQEPPEAEVIVEEFAKKSGYEPIQTVASYAGYKDWFIQDFKRPGYTVELGKGVNPLPIEQFDKIYNDSLGICLAGLYM